MVQVYELRITYLAGNAEIAVLKGSQEVGVERFSGKVCGGPAIAGCFMAR